jgi:hypothetical protein
VNAGPWLTCCLKWLLAHTLRRAFLTVSQSSCTASFSRLCLEKKNTYIGAEATARTTLPPTDSPLVGPSPAAAFPGSLAQLTPERAVAARHSPRARPFRNSIHRQKTY